MSQQNMISDNLQCDLVVVGAGAGGLSTAITAKKRGLNVVVIEKEDVFGGTTAFSGGVLWIPGNSHAKQNGIQDTTEKARQYIKNEAGEFFREEEVNVFLENGPKMVDFFEKETSVKFIPTLYPDYHPNLEGGVDIGRSILAKPYDIRELGDNMSSLRPPLQTITFMGMMFNSSNADLKHFFNATKSFTSFIYVAKRLLKHFKEISRYKRGVDVTAGNALAARLAKSAFDLDIPIYTKSAAQDLIVDNEKVAGIKVLNGNNQTFTIHAKQGVVLAAGGFSHDIERISSVYPHLKRGGQHLSPVPSANTGDGVRIAEKAGADIDLSYKDASAWMPVSAVPMKNGTTGVFPHLLDRYKPGVIGVLANGKRFTNESESYHDVGAAMIQACEGQKETFMWLICDAKTMGKYGLGYAKPSPLPLSPLIKSGYLKKGATIKALAESTGINAAELSKTIQNYNVSAEKGEDPEYHRGSSSFNRFLADPDNKPNPCVAPVKKGPFYAVKVYMGDLGTFDGIRTTTNGQVLNKSNAIIDGLYAVGNDRLSVMGGKYPGAGITLGPIMTFGYVTGNFIADKTNSN